MAIGTLYLAICDAAQDCGVDTNAVLGAANLTRAALADPTLRISPEIGRILGRELVRRCRNPMLGLLAAQRFELRDFDLVGYLVRNSRTLLCALEAFARFGRLLGDTADCRVELRKGGIDVSIGRIGGRNYPDVTSDFLVGIVARLVRDGFPGAPSPLEVRLPRAAPPEAALYRLFFGAPVVFDAPVPAILYPTKAAGVRSPDADLRLGSILREHAARALGALPRDESLAERLRAMLASELENGNDLVQVAARIGMSERTLRRRLREAGTSYRKLLDEVRRERALALLGEGDHNVSAVAASLGFTDVSSFARAFRRWTKQLPSDFLRRRATATASTRE